RAALHCRPLVGTGLEGKRTVDIWDIGPHLCQVDRGVDFVSDADEQHPAVQLVQARERAFRAEWIVKGDFCGEKGCICAERGKRNDRMVAAKGVGLLAHDFWEDAYPVHFGRRRLAIEEWDFGALPFQLLWRCGRVAPSRRVAMVEGERRDKQCAD